MTDTFKHIKVSLPEKYTEADAARLRAAFPGIQTFLNRPCFSVEEEDEGPAPLPELRAVFAWVEKHL